MEGIEEASQLHIEENQQTSTRRPGHPFGDYFDNNSTRSSNLLNTRQLQKMKVINWARSKGYYTLQQELSSKSGPFVIIEGLKYKMLSSYDYLGLIGHESIEQAAIEAIHEFGTSSGGVRLLTGTNKLHIELEKELASFKGTESALTFSSGYHANLAVISSLFDSKEMILVDSKIHQSTIDACKLAGVPYRRFAHRNSKSLEDLLKRYSGSRRILVISEGVFSMDGDVCDLRQIVDMKNKYGAILMIDESHSLGVLGKNGRGVDSYFDIAPDEVDIFTGSLSKAIPANGGFVAGSKELIIFLQHDSSTYIFSAAMGPAATAAALASIKIMEAEPERHQILRSNTEYLKSELEELGYDTGLSSSPIIPLMLGQDEYALKFSKKLFEMGILATPVVFPAVPKNQARLRLCVTAAQDKSFLTEIVEVFRELRS